MKQPLSTYVAQVLREKKMIYSELNFKHPSKWDEEYYKEWQQILDGVPVVQIKTVNPRKNTAHRVKVIRLSDNYVFDSIGECMKIEGILQHAMSGLLKSELKYKRVAV
jgi:transcription antitermination factor NusA-like protein